MTRPIIVIQLCLLAGGAVVNAQMDPYFSTISHPLPQGTMMVMLLSDFQSARSTNDFFTGASLYKMEVAGFGGEDLPARRTPIRRPPSPPAITDSVSHDAGLALSGGVQVSSGCCSSADPVYISD